MAVNAVTIPVSPDVARLYDEAPAERRDLAIQMFSSILRRRTREEAVASLLESQERLSQQAKESGLTPKILDSILRERG